MNSRALPTKILIVDDHPMMREGIALRLSLEPDLQVCGEAASEVEALAMVDKSAPDVMLIDISLKSGNGIELIKQIKSLHPKIKMLVVSGFDESLYAERALRAGALGYLNKQDSNDNLIKAIRTILVGKRFMSAETAQRFIGQSLGDASQSGNPIDVLSNRELEVFRLIGEGLSTSIIAKRLFLSPNTVETHREHIKFKLGLDTAGKLTRAAVQWVLENG